MRMDNRKRIKTFQCWTLRPPVYATDELPQKPQWLYGPLPNMGDADKIERSMQDDRKFRLWNMFAFIFYCGIRLRSLSHYSCPLQFTSLTFFNRGSTKYGINRIDQKHSSESSKSLCAAYDRGRKSMTWTGWILAFCSHVASKSSTRK